MMTIRRWFGLALIAGALAVGLAPTRAADPVIIPNLPDATGVVQSNSLPCWQAGQAVNTRTRECTIAEILNTLEAAQVTAALGYTPLDRAGGTMTGPLVLSGAPSSGLHATTKTYVDAQVAAATTPPGGSSGQLQYNSGGAFAGMPAVSGDATLNTATGVATLGASGVSAGTYGSASLIPVITVDAKGRATAITTAAAGASALTYRNVTGTTDTLLQADLGKIVTFTNAADVVVTIPQAGSGGNFAAGWHVWVRNINATTLAKFTTTTSNINGNASRNFTLGPQQYAKLISDGADWFVEKSTSGGTGPNSAIIAYGGNYPGDGSAAAVSMTGSNNFIIGRVVQSSGGTMTLSANGAGVIGGGGISPDTVSGGGSVIVAGGGGSTISAPNSAILGGTAAISGAGTSVAVGGIGNVMSGANAVQLGGVENTVDGYGSVGMGSNSNSRGRRYSFQIGGGWNGNRNNGWQSGFTNLGARITGTTAVELYTNDGYTSEFFKMADATVLGMQMTCQARNRSVYADVVTFVLRTGGIPGATIQRDASAAATALAGAPTFDVVTTAGNGSELTMAVGADTTNGRPQFTATASTARDWFVSCFLQYSETFIN